MNNVTGSDVYESDTVEQASNEMLVRFYARTVQNNRQLRKIIRDIDPKMREAVYNLIAPHLKFKPLSYLLLKP